MIQSKPNGLLDWNSKEIPQAQRDQFLDEVLTRANLRRVLWTILCFLPLSTFFLVCNFLEDADLILIYWGIVDVILSLGFLLATRYALRKQLANKSQRILVGLYYAFCLTSTVTYDLIAYPTVGEAPIYVVGVILPAVLYHIPSRQALSMLAIIHAIYSFFLWNGGRPPNELLGVWITGTFGIILASLAASYLFSREWKYYQQIKIIERTNSQLTELNEQLGKQKNEMNDIMALAAHDMRSPLIEMKGLFDVLVTKKEWNEQPYAEVLELTRESCSRQLALLKSLLDSYRAEYSSFNYRSEKLCLVKVLNQAISQFTDPEFAIELQCEERTAQLVSDPALLKQILDNLLSNAVKFSPVNGTISLSLSKCSEKWIIKVADEGPGIPKNERDRLFNKFFRASSGAPIQQGAGLGLFIVAQLSKTIGGEINYTQRQPIGSIFALSLPVKTNSLTG